ncbi:MAG: 3-phosphoshikimate 1-carboxyvinyltransferase [Bacteroidales bacterium]
MTKSIPSTNISGRLIAPASKSVAQRAIVAALLAKGTSHLQHLTLCADTSAALQAASTLGAVCTPLSNQSYSISSDFFALQDDQLHINCGESGLLVRMLTPVLALRKQSVVIQGHGSLNMRPLSMLELPLQHLGASITSNHGFLPLHVQGAIRGGRVRVDGSLSSQQLTGLLMALPLAGHDSTLSVSQLKSSPYIDLTIELLRDFGITIEHHHYEEFYIKGNQSYRASTYSIEGDWSGASCLLVGGAIAGEIQVDNLRASSTQADKLIVDALRMAGALVEQTPDSVRVSKSTLKAFSFDATHCPDLFPALVALAACCQGSTQLVGAQRLLHKESNRALSLQSEFAKLGIHISLDGDMMRVQGGGLMQGAHTLSHNDHRIAMALATAALCCSTPVNIEGAECVNKSYPDFWRDLEQLTQ